MNHETLFTTALLLLTASACAPGPNRHHYLHKEAKPHAAAWGYEGTGAPEHWGDLCPEYHLAKDGRQQSPVDIRGAASSDLPPLEFDYRPVTVRTIYNGHSVQENEDGKSHLVVQGKSYDLEQFHFHSPSEHTVEGQHFAMELHFVHEGADGEVAVVGVLIEAGLHNAAFETMWADLPDGENPTESSQSRIVVQDLLPADHRYYGYQGSFTTPPCTERVRWFVLREPVQLSSEQIATFREVIFNNNRPVQPLNDREVLVGH